MWTTFTQHRRQFLPHVITLPLTRSQIQKQGKLNKWLWEKHPSGEYSEQRLNNVGSNPNSDIIFVHQPLLRASERNPTHTIYKKTRKQKPLQLLKKCQEETISLRDSTRLSSFWLCSQICLPQVAAKMTTACLGLHFSSSAIPGERDMLFSKGSIKSHRMKFHWPGFSHMLTSEPITVVMEMQVFWVARPGTHAHLWWWRLEQPQSNHMDWDLGRVSLPKKTRVLCPKGGNDC